MQAHYVEIVSKTVDKQCKALEQVHGLSFGPEVQDLGRAQVAKTPNGVLIGVRAPLAEHEQPIVRIYFAVDDITKAVKAAGEMSLPFTGGSDSHAPHEVGSCYTEFLNKVTYENFIDLLKDGNYQGVDTRKISRVWPFQ